MTADLRALIALAEKATPGPWEYKLGPGTFALVATETAPFGVKTGECLFDSKGCGPKPADGRYIAAADPQTIIGLCKALQGYLDAGLTAEERTFIAICCDILCDKDGQRLEKIIDRLRGGEPGEPDAAVIELRAALRNMADAYVRKVKTGLTADDIAKEPWRCLEYIEAERLCKKPFKLHFTKEWLRERISESDDEPGGIMAGNPDGLMGDLVRAELERQRTEPAPTAGTAEEQIAEIEARDQREGPDNRAYVKDKYGEQCFHDRATLLRLLREGRGWKRSADCPDDIQILAGLNLPVLGMSCTQAAMHHSGKRYVFVYDNPAPAKGFWWLELQPLPSPPTVASAPGEKI